ncbi:MAG: hypothetical protein ACYCT1_03765 [Steroidobacteraceae bacterium]
MERLLLWWDDLDDLAAVCRHLLRAAFAEALAFALTPAWGSLIGQWLRLPA